MSDHRDGRQGKKSFVRKLKNTLKRGILRVHRLGTRVGIHILPVHYYSPLPSLLELERTRDSWAGASDMPGVAVDLAGQVARLQATCRPFASEFAGNTAYRQGVEGDFGPGYGYIEAQALHAVVRSLKPRRIVEVGSGVSTWCMVHAARMNTAETGDAAEITCIEPFPSAALRSLPGIRLVASRLQDAGLDVFRQLDENDLLFIDSSHAVKPGSDVNRLVLEILPRLRPGVVVHLHDIFFPYDYQPDVLRTFLHWTETSLLRAWLIDNARASIMFCLSHLHDARQDALREVFPEYRPRPARDGMWLDPPRPFDPCDEHAPSSIYIRIGG